MQAPDARFSRREIVRHSGENDQNDPVTMKVYAKTITAIPFVLRFKRF